MDYINKIYQTLNILCVEDDEEILEAYKELFSIVFKRVYFARDGLSGLEKFKNYDIDIVLTDYMMPHCTGIEMSNAIREIDSSVPIILVTALKNVEVLREAIDAHVTSFLPKPFNHRDLFSVFDLSVKSVMADRIMLKEQKSKIDYISYQEQLTYDKEKLIIKDDTKNKHLLGQYKCNVYYKSLDILSGDSYVIRELNENKYLIFLIDGMGKGVSASVTAMLCSAFVNYHISKIIDSKEKFILDELLKSLVEFIQPNILDEEVISASFLFYNNISKELEYSIFSMPPIFYTMNDSKIHKIRSNNTSLSAFTKNVYNDKIIINNFEKMLIYSDGLNENCLKGSKELYGSFIQSDFLKAKDTKNFQKLFFNRIDIQEDDITYIFIQNKV